MKELKDLEDVLYHEVQLLYSGESLLIKAMPAMIKNASNNELKAALALHLEETELHKERLEKVAKYLDIDADGDSNPSMKGLITEGEKVMHKDATPATLDATIIAAAQKIEHYEIASYGTAAHLATELGFQFVAELLQQTLQEEKDTNRKLNDLAMSGINQKAKVPL
jgi:ferritin-like metal-binding protein YciE